MREHIRLIFAALFYYSGLVRLALWWQQQHSGSQLIILDYHRAVGQNLRSQMRYLGRAYRVMHIEEALEELYAPHNCKKRSLDKRIPLVLTFDDAYLDNYTYALQLVRELQIPITIYVIPGYVESGAYLWWLAADYLVRHTQIEQITLLGRTYILTQAGEREALAQAIDQRARNASSVAEREAFLADMRQALQVSLPYRTGDVCDDPELPMTWAELREMERSRLVSFGAHTMHHPVLACLSDEEELRYEVEQCKKVMHEHLGHAVNSFAYPVGKLRHIGDKAVQTVKAAGYKWALSTIEQVNTPQTDPYMLGRLPGVIETHWLIMASELAGLLGILSRFKKKML